MPQLELCSFRHIGVRFNNELERLPLIGRSEVLIVEQRFPTGCVLHGKLNAPALHAFGSGSNGDFVPLTAAHRDVVLGQHEGGRLLG